MHAREGMSVPASPKDFVGLHSRTEKQKKEDQANNCEEVEGFSYGNTYYARLYVVREDQDCWRGDRRRYTRERRSFLQTDYSVYLIHVYINSHKYFHAM